MKTTACRLFCPKKASMKPKKKLRWTIRSSEIETPLEADLEKGEILNKIETHLEVDLEKGETLKIVL